MAVQPDDDKTGKQIIFHNLRRCAVRGRGMVGWCYRMCTPKGELGLCGFPAAHAAHSKTGLILKELKAREDMADSTGGEGT